MSRCRWAFMFLVWPLWAVHGQEALGIGNLSSQGLLEQVRILKQSADEQRSAYDLLVLEDLQLQRDVEARTAELGSLASAPAPVADTSLAVWENTEIALRWAEREVELERSRVVSIEASVPLVRRRVVLVDEKLRRARALASALEALQPFRSELERRLAAGQLTSETMPPELHPSALQVLLPDTTALTSLRPALASQLAQQQSSIDAGAARAQKQQEQRAQFEAAHREAMLRKDLTASIASRDVSELHNQLLKRLEEWTRQDARVPRPPRLLDESAAMLDRQLATLASLPPPNPDSIAIPAGGPPDLQLAQKQVLLSEKRQAYYSERAAQLNQLEAALSPHVDAIRSYQQDLETLYSLTLGLDVLRSVLEVALRTAPANLTVPSGAQAGVLAEVLSSVRQQREASASRLETRRLQLEQMRSQLAANNTALQGVERELPQAREKLEREKSWASWSQELGQLDNASLLQAFGAAQRQQTEARQALELARRAVQEARDQGRTARTQAREFVDPLVRQVRLALSGHRDAILDALESLESEAQELPGLPEWPPLANGAADNEFDFDVWVGTMEQSRNAYLARLRVYADSREAVAKELAARRLEQDRLRALAEKLSTVLDRAQRVYGAAWALELRAMLNKIERAALPPEHPAALARESILELQLEIERVRSELRRSEAFLAYREENEAKEAQLFGAIQARLDQTVKRIDLLRSIQELQAAQRAWEQSAELNETEQRLARQEVLVRMRADDPWYAPLLSLAESEQSSELSSVIEEYTRQLLELQARQDNYLQQTSKIERLLGSVRAEQSILAQLEPQLIDRQARNRLEMNVQQLRVRAQLVTQPQEREALLLRLQNELKETPDAQGLAASLAPAMPMDPATRAEQLPGLADGIFFTRINFLAYNDWLEQVRRARGRQGRLGRLERAVAALEDQRAAIEAEQSELQAALNLLQGHSQEDFERLEPEDQPTKEPEISQYFLGRLGWTRQERTYQRMKDGLQTVILLAFIPLFSWLLVRGTNRLGAKVLERVQRSLDDIDGPTREATRKERQDRARTLLHVFRAAFTMLVVVLASIYFLKALRIDVTPLIASAGILGLAVAFGAQPLMRDFFAGFFILLENQYKLGDVVKVNDTTGTVEKVSLRLTMVRDREGTLHFIPNGTVNMVSNMTKEWAQAVLLIGAAYHDSPDTVIQCLREVGDNLRSDPVFGPKILDYVVPGLESFGDSSVVYRVNIKVVSGEQWAMPREARRRIMLAFGQQGITIPFPQRVVHYEGPDSGKPKGA